MKRIIGLALSLAMIFALVACGGGEEAKPEEPLDLTGTWIQEDAEDSYQKAVIKDGTIEINWVSEEDETEALYWIGTYVAPTEATEEYTWTSEGDTETMASALLASQDETKEFTYTDGKLTYKASAMGVTTTIKLAREE